MTTHKISKADQFYATQWLHVMLDRDDWLSDQLDRVLDARNEFRKICLASKPDKINAFCATWLSPEQQEELHRSVNAARKRHVIDEELDEDHSGAILTHRAKFILERLALQEECTISDVIETHLLDLVDCEIPYRE